MRILAILFSELYRTNFKYYYILVKGINSSGLKKKESEITNLRQLFYRNGTWGDKFSHNISFTPTGSK